MKAACAKKLRPGEEAAEEGAHSASGARADDAPAAAGPSSSAISAVFLQLLPRIATSMSRNEVACVLRLLCKAAAATLRGPQHATVHLSEPTPPTEFQWRWCGPQSLRSTTFNQRRQLERLTARSGVVANFESLIALGGLPRLSCPSSEWRYLFNAAAGAGRLELCRWLVEQQHVPFSVYSLQMAAVGGHADVCEWLLDRGCTWDPGALCSAARHGHVRLAERLLQLKPQAAPFDDDAARQLVLAAAYGCDLATLQRLHAEHVASRGLDIGLEEEPRNIYDDDACCGYLCAAASSPTPDWAAKVEWVEGFGCLRSSDVAGKVAERCCTDAAARLAWMYERAYPMDVDIRLAASSAGALRFLLSHGLHLTPDRLPYEVLEACENGSLEALQVLWGAGGWLDAGALEAAAMYGNLRILSWAAEQLGDVRVRSDDLFRAAAKSGSLPLLRGLHERGAGMWDAGVFAAAAQAGCEEVLEWLVDHGCPMGEDGAAYAQAAKYRDLPTLRCLVRLGCPFAPDGSTFTESVLEVRSWLGGDMDARSLQWLLDAGCPVDWDAAIGGVRQASGNNDPLLDWLQQQRQQRGV